MSSQIELVETTKTQDTTESKKLPQKLLLIETDHYLSNAFAELSNESFYNTFRVPANERLGEWLKNQLSGEVPNMIVVDVGISSNEALPLISNIRALYDGLIVVVSSINSEREQINALKNGADDYLQKPMDKRILMLRIEGLFKRQRSGGSQVELASISLGDVCLQPKSQKCFVSSKGVRLTNFEFKLLKTLIEQQGKILTRDQLYTSLLRRNYNGVERTLDVRVSQLREKLTAAGMQKNKIETVWGQGYMLSNTAT
jgi:DNA-binding response OmpR family regulator